MKSKNWSWSIFYKETIIDKLIERSGELAPLLKSLKKEEPDDKFIEALFNVEKYYDDIKEERFKYVAKRIVEANRDFFNKETKGVKFSSEELLNTPQDILILQYVLRKYTKKIRELYIQVLREAIDNFHLLFVKEQQNLVKKVISAAFWDNSEKGMFEVFTKLKRGEIPKDYHRVATSYLESLTDQKLMQLYNVKPQKNKAYLWIQNEIVQILNRRKYEPKKYYYGSFVKTYNFVIVGDKKYVMKPTLVTVPDDSVLSDFGNKVKISDKLILLLPEGSWKISATSDTMKTEYVTSIPNVKTYFCKSYDRVWDTQVNGVDITIYKHPDVFYSPQDFPLALEGCRLPEKVSPYNAPGIVFFPVVGEFSYSFPKETNSELLERGLIYLKDIYEIGNNKIYNPTEEKTYKCSMFLYLPKGKWEISYYGSSIVEHVDTGEVDNSDPLLRIVKEFVLTNVPGYNEIKIKKVIQS